MKLRIVHASRANRFMRDILEGIAHEAEALGADAEVVDDVFDPDPDTAHLVIPHEYFSVTDPALWPDAGILGRTIALTVEHPGTPWFEISAQQVYRCAAAVDINRDAAAELKRRGVRVLPFQIGYTERWDHWRGGDGERDIDILYMGSTDEKRDRMLASAAPWWADVNVRLLVPGTAPKPEDGADSVTGSRKYDLLARSQLMINAHRLEAVCLEWIRVIEAMCNGCVVVSEHSTDAAPLRPGEHFISGGIDTLGLLSRGILDSPDDIDRLRHAAYDFIRAELPMRPAVETLLELAEDCVRRPRTMLPPADVPHPPRPQPIRPAWPQTASQLDIIGMSVRRIEQRMRTLERDLQQLTMSERPTSLVTEAVRTPAMDVTEPRVSVIIPLYNHADEVVEALSSVVATRGPSIEVLVYDDASTDGSGDVVADFLSTRPWLAGGLYVGALNRGLSIVRNELLSRARGEFTFVLDADNGVYPDVLARLTAALDEDPDAAFAYTPLAVRRGHVFTRLVSSRPWQPELFRQGNYIDAMALLRTQTLLALGGWDADMDGWEDFHLWVRIAEAGMYGAFVPQALSWYRGSEHSMSIEIAAHSVGLWSRIRAAAPTIMRE